MQNAISYLQIEKEGLSCEFSIKRSFLTSLVIPLHSSLITSHVKSAMWSETYLNASFSQNLTWVALSVNVRVHHQFRSTSDHAKADAMSRLTLEDTLPKSDVSPELILLVDHLEASPITVEHSKHTTR